MSTEQPDALRLATILGNEFDTYTDTWSAKEAAAELRRQHAEIETLRTGYKAARLEIASLHAQLEAAQAAPVGMEPVYQIDQQFLFDPENTWRDASKDAYDVHMPNRRRIIYTAAQVQAMLVAKTQPTTE